MNNVQNKKPHDTPKRKPNTVFVPVLRMLTVFLLIVCGWLIVLILIEFPVQDRSLYAYPGSGMTGHEQYILEKRTVQKVNDGSHGVRIADISGKETVELDSCLSFASKTENYLKSEAEHTYIVSISSAGLGAAESVFEVRKLKVMCGYSAEDVLMSSFGGGRLFDGILHLPITAGLESGVTLPERNDLLSEPFSIMAYRSEYIDDERAVLFAEPVVSAENRTYVDTTRGWSSTLGLDAIFTVETKEELRGYIDGINVTKHVFSPDCLDGQCNEVILPSVPE